MSIIILLHANDLMKKSELLEIIEKNFPEIVQTASELVRIPSRNPPGEEKRCAEYIYSRLKESGLETHLVNEPYSNRPQVVAIARGENENTILLNGHIDTVPEGDPESWTMDPFSGNVKDGLLYGIGSVDMKSALAIMMHVAEFANTNGNILLTFAVGEERAELGTSTLLSYVKKFNLKIRYGLVLEPTTLNVASCQKGGVWFKIKLKGRASHASAPDQGINAIEMASKVMQAINDYRIFIAKRKHRLADPPTCTVTMISGGFKENVIPDKCELVIDRRLVPGESSNVVEQELRSFIDRSQLDYELEKIGSREPVEIDDNSAIAKAVLDATSEVTGSNVSTVCFPGATDNEHLVANGIQSLVWGPGNLNKAHAIDECISINEIKHGTVTLALLLNRLLV
ncbi:MAG: M20 family metallopeptidase [Nitrososphaerales archaeon]